jgi:hypothetical protein
VNPMTPAEQLDEAVEQLLSGTVPRTTPELRPLVETASLIARALPPIPASDRFDARLRARLAATNPILRAADAVGDFTRRELRQPRHLLAAGAVSSAAVGMGVTALVVWRGSRRGAATRRGHR